MQWDAHRHDCQFGSQAHDLPDMLRTRQSHVLDPLKALCLGHTFKGSPDSMPGDAAAQDRFCRDSVSHDRVRTVSDDREDY